MRPAPPPWPSRRSATAQGRRSSPAVAVQVRDVAPGLWLWRQPHPDWREGNDWEPEVSSVVVVSGGEVILLDPLAPPPLAGAEVWRRLDEQRPTLAIVQKP